MGLFYETPRYGATSKRVVSFLRPTERRCAERVLAIVQA